MVLEFIGGTYEPLLKLGENFVGCSNGACAGLWSVRSPVAPCAPAAAMVRTARTAGAYRFGLSRRLCATYSNLRFHPPKCAKLMGTIPSGER